MQPLIKYTGSKQKEIPQILSHIPDTYNRYVEPFVGGGSLYFYLEPTKALISDTHSDLISIYKSIHDGYAQKIREFMENHPNNETTYYNVRSWNTQTRLEKAQKFFYLNKTAFRGIMRYNSNGEFNVPYGRYKKINWSQLKNQNLIELLRNTDIREQDYKEIFEEVDENDFVFLDPPYDSNFKKYGQDAFTEDDQRELAQYFAQSPAKCLMIIGETELTANLYHEYIVERYHKKYAFRIYSNRVGDEINNNHLVIRNY
jgi:DNA adenine methylase